MQALERRMQALMVRSCKVVTPSFQVKEVVISAHEGAAAFRFLLEADDFCLDSWVAETGKGNGDTSSYGWLVEGREVGIIGNGRSRGWRGEQGLAMNGFCMTISSQNFWFSSDR